MSLNSRKITKKQRSLKIQNDQAVKYAKHYCKIIIEPLVLDI